MPKNLVRYQKCGVFHFITFSCYRRKPLLIASRQKLQYMHRNPVRRGLVTQPEDWPWSSYLHYATGKEGTVEIESQWTARKREMNNPVVGEQHCFPPFAKNAKDGAPSK